MNFRGITIITKVHSFDSKIDFRILFPKITSQFKIMISNEYFVTLDISFTILSRLSIVVLITSNRHVISMDCVMMEIFRAEDNRDHYILPRILSSSFIWSKPPLKYFSNTDRPSPSCCLLSK